LPGRSQRSAARLIDKAAWAWSGAPLKPRAKDNLVALAKLQAFGAVAADILLLCAAPISF
jgi:hypothetical protein